MSDPGPQALPVLNLEVARFECTFGRGCEGVCCREGKPLLYPDEVERLDSSLPRLLAALRPKARAVLKRKGYLSRRRRYGQPVVRNAGGWCVFFNAGCVLHRAGAAEGEPFRYKPAVCALFPVQRDGRGRWYVRQKGYKGEKWDLACLDPQASAMPAVESLAGELALARRYTEEEGQGQSNFKVAVIRLPVLPAPHAHNSRPQKGDPGLGRVTGIPRCPRTRARKGGGPTSLRP